MTRCAASTCAITCVIFAISTLGRSPQGTPDQSTNADRKPAAFVGSAVQILTPTEGVDFAPFLNHLLSTVKRNWYAKMPEAARLGIKGKVTVRFRILKDGTLTDQPPSVDEGSGTKTLDDAAVAAIRNSTPFEHLPDAFKGPNIELRFSFLYNLPLSPRGQLP
jgi:TonB family protein